MPIRGGVDLYGICDEVRFFADVVAAAPLPTSNAFRTNVYMDRSHQEELASLDRDLPRAGDGACESAAAPSGISPSSSGPAGALFEGQVAAHYLLPMLAEAEPRGLPGVAIERIELQRAGEG